MDKARDMILADAIEQAIESSHQIVKMKRIIRTSVLINFFLASILIVVLICD